MRRLRRVTFWKRREGVQQFKHTLRVSFFVNFSAQCRRKLQIELDFRTRLSLGFQRTSNVFLSVILLRARRRTFHPQERLIVQNFVGVCRFEVLSLCFVEIFSFSEQNGAHKKIIKKNFGSRLALKCHRKTKKFLQLT